MKDFLKELGKTISDTAEMVGKKTEDVVEVQKLKSQIRTLNRGNERDFEDMGKMLFEKYKSGEVLEPEVMTICDAVQERNETMDALEKEIARIEK